MIEDDGAALGGDATGEADPDGDPHALSNLGFEPAGGPGDELVSRVIEEEHGGGIAAQELQHPVEQQGQQLVRIDSGE